MRHRSLLAYANYRYLKVAAAVSAAAILAYALERAPAGRYGGTWLGYTLGTIGALLIAWLAWFGVSALFALIHVNLPTFVPLFALALALTWLYERTDNLLAPIIAHALFNAANFAVLLWQIQHSPA